MCLCDWTDAPHHTAILRRATRELRAVLKEESAADTPHATLDMAAHQLDEYFQGARSTFSVPLRAVGTPFQQAVWRSMTRVPYGRTLPYSALARAIGSPNAVRAVAAAVGANGLSIFLPCHRIIGAGGALTGYAGGLTAKRFLLELETER